jgi:hypothetical protein
MNGQDLVGLALLDVTEGIEPISHPLFTQLHPKAREANKELLLRWLDLSLTCSVVARPEHGPSLQRRFGNALSEEHRPARAGK